jgi:hypothetical protein
MGTVIPGGLASLKKERLLNWSELQPSGYQQSPRDIFFFGLRVDAWYDWGHANFDLRAGREMLVCY